MKKKEILENIGIYVSKEVKRSLEKAAKQEERSVSAVIRMLIKQYLDSKGSWYGV
mgnify:CR=1 FL=1